MQVLNSPKFVSVELANQPVGENHPQNKVSNSVEKIPIRTTVLSALSMVPYILVLFAISNVNLARSQIGLISRIVLQLQVALRCPLAAMLTFKFVKKQNSDIQASLRSLQQRREVQSISSNF